MTAKSMRLQFTPSSVALPGSGIARLSAIATAGTASRAAVMRTQRRTALICMSCVMFSLMICAAVSANVPSAKACSPRSASVRSRMRSVKVCVIGSPKRSR
jgi:hypothetical protein